MSDRLSKSITLLSAFLTIALSVGASTSNAATRHVPVVLADDSPSAKTKPQVNFSVFTIGEPGVPLPTTRTRDIIRRVLAALPKDERGSLMFTLRAYANHDVMLYVGLPHDGLRSDGSQLWVHPIGEACNMAYNASEADLEPFPNEDDCRLSPPSKADRIVQRAIKTGGPLR